jgi:hypothetical protein
VTTTVDREEWRWRAYPLAIIGSILAAIVLVVATAEDSSTLTGNLGGDFPTFYAAGAIVRDGDGARLYDTDRQAAEQAEFWETEGTMILYVYPPVLAVPYAALSAMDFRLAYLLHTAFMLGALVLSLRLVADLLPVLGQPGRLFAAFAFALCFHPMFTGATLGQNTALILLALSATWWGLANHRDVVAGLAVGLLLLKPQYGAPILGLVVLTRRWSAVSAAAATAAALWAGSVVISGGRWHESWFELVGSLSEVDQGSNLSNEVSWLGLFEVALGAGSDLALALWVIATAITVGMVLWRLHASSWLDLHALALIPPMLLLIAPHALYYDAGILLLSLAALLPTVEPRWRPHVLGAWLVLGLGSLVSGALGVQPVAVLVFGTFAWAWWASAPGRLSDAAPAEATTGVEASSLEG